MLTDAIVEGPPPIVQVRTVSVAPAKFDEAGDHEECATPRSEEALLKPAVVCPPAPRKPRPSKRKRSPLPKGYFTAPRDLSSVFVPVPRGTKKRIRAGCYGFSKIQIDDTMHV